MPSGYCEYRIEDNTVLFEFYGLYYMIYGTSMWGSMDSWKLSSCSQLFKDFFAEYEGCVYESVLMPVQGGSSCDMGGIFIFTNDPEEKYEYSFSCLLPDMLATLKDGWEWNSDSLKSANQFLSRIAPCDWIPQDWYNKLLDGTKDVAMKAALLEAIRQKFG